MNPYATGTTINTIAEQSFTGQNISCSPNSVSFPNTVATTATATYTTATTTTYSLSLEVDKIIAMMPILCKVGCVVKTANENKLKIMADRISPKSNNVLLFPDHGTLYFEGDIWGTYAPHDYYYWDDTIIVEFESPEMANKIKENTLFTTANNWDNHITNDEVKRFIENRNFYRNFAHIELEKILSTKYKDSTLNVDKLWAHRKLDEELNLYNDQRRIKETY